MKISTSLSIVILTLTSLLSTYSFADSNTPDFNKYNKETANQLKVLTQTINNALGAYAYSSYQQTPILNGLDYYTNNYTKNKALVTQQTQNDTVDSTLAAVNSLLKQFSDETVPSKSTDSTDSTVNTAAGNSDDSKDNKTIKPPSSITNLQTLTGVGETTKNATNIRGTDNLLSIQGPADLLYNGNNASFSYNTFMNNPIADSFTYDSTLSTNYLNILTNSYDFNSAWFNNPAMQSLYNALATLAQSDPAGVDHALHNESSPYRRFTHSLQLSTDFLGYKARYRSAVAARSMMVGTLLNLQKERECGTKKDGSTDCNNHPSPVAIQHKIDTWRVQSPAWHNFIASASSTTLMREMVQIQAQELSNQDQAHLDREKIESLLALENIQLQKQTSAMNVSATSQLKKTIESTKKQVTGDTDSSDSDSDSGSKS